MRQQRDAVSRRRGAGTLVFDGDCGFCTTSAGWARRLAPGATTVAWQLADLDRLGGTPDAGAAGPQYGGPDGRVSSGSDAIAQFLLVRGGVWAVPGRLLPLPGVRAVAAAAYRVI